MNQSEIIIITITGLLQLSVAVYGLRLTHQYGVARVGWSLFCAFALLALTHLFEAVRQFNTARQFEIKIEVVYAFISFLLLTGMAHIESVLKERRRIERQARKMETIGQLAEGITHDFNNIIASIQGYVSLLLLKQHDLETTEQLNQIAGAANRAGGLTRQLLAFGRGHSAQFEFLNLNTLIEELIQMLRPLIGATIRLEYAPVSNLPLIAGDATMIEEVIINLAVNARDAMPQGGTLTIGVAAENVDRSHVTLHHDARVGEFVCIRVCDTGCGMSSEMLTHIFEPFFTTKEAGKGTGLGLATVQRIVAQHSGWVEIQSNLGVGTEFAVYFPCAPHSVVEARKEQVLA